MFCPKCGAQVKADDAICGNCGFPQKVRNGEEKTEISNTFDDNKTVVFNNGNAAESIADESVADIDKTVAAADFGFAPQNVAGEALKPEVPVVPNAIPSAVPVPPVTPAAQPPAPKEKKSVKINKKKIIGAIVTVVVIAAAAVAAWFAATHFMSQNAMQISGGFEQELQLGKKYLKDMNYEKALLAYENAIEINENSAEAQYGYARANAGLLEYGKAEEAYKKAISLDEMYADAYNGLIELYIQQDSEENPTADKAKALVDKAINEKKINDPVLVEKYHGMNPEKPSTNVDPRNYNDGARYAVALSDKYGGAIYYTHEYPGADSGYGYELTPKVYSEPIVLQNGRNVIKAYVVSSYGFTSESATFEYNINRTDTPLTFVDPVVESAVRSAIGKNYGEIYDDEVATITELSIVGSHYTDQNSTFTQTEYFIGSGYGSSYQGSVTNLSDLRYMPFLNTLNISFQQNLDISTLAGCDYLENLSLINVNLTSVDKIANLKYLKKLCLGWNSVTDISALGSLTELTHLGVWGNKITDISVVSKLTKLEYLDVSDNSVSDISAVAGLAELVEFWAYGNRISNFAPIVSLNKLKVLMISGNPVGDMADLRKVYPRLTKVDIQIV